MIQKNEPLSSKDFSKGLVTRSDIIKNDATQSPNCMDIKWFFDGSIGKRMGASTTNSIVIGSTAVSGWTIDSGGTLSTSIGEYFKLDEPSGNRVGQFRNVSLVDVGTVGSVVGIRGQAAQFIATNSQMLLSNTGGIFDTGNVNFSISTWLWLDSTSGTVERSLVTKRPVLIDTATVLLLHGDNAGFPDAGIHNYSITTAGNPTIDTTQSQFGGSSIKFVGADPDALLVPDNADWRLDGGTSTNSWTVDFWVRFNSTNARMSIISQYASATSNWQIVLGNGPTFAYIVNDSTKAETNPGFNTGQWYHFAVVNSSGSVMMFVDGTQSGATGTAVSLPDISSVLAIGSANSFATNNFDGWVDEIRISKGIARWTSAFARPTAPYGTRDFEYSLFVNTDNVITFRVSSSGIAQDATVRATSFGAVTTSTWLNVIAWHSNNSHVGVSVNLSQNTAAYTSGLKVGSSNFALGSYSNSTVDFMDGRVDETGFWNKVLSLQERKDLFGGGSGNTFSSGASGFGWAMFDFGASAIRWLTVAAGTGIVASSNLGTTFVTIATSRTQTYQYLDRSKNVLIATSDAYDVPLFWAGSAGTFASTLSPGSAPNCKYSINYQGFLILLNSSSRKRGFFYADENLQLTDAWTNSFDIPSSADDEITGAFVLYKFLYVSTRYKIYRVAFVGGNPDWTFLKVKDWGFVPRTAKLMTLKGSQVVVGLDWQRRERVFDGFDDLFISDNVENNNNYCDFAMSKISFAGSGLTLCHAEFDPIEQEYRLNVAIGAQSTQTTHAIVLNGRTLAMFPYSNQMYQAMCVAESNNQQHLMAVDRSGFVHILNSGNLDVSQPINDIFDSPLLFKDSPAEVSKAQQMNFYFNTSSAGVVYHQDRLDFSSIFSSVRPLKDRDGNTQLLGTENYLQILRTIDIPATYNTYQFRLTSSSGTANPWELTKFELMQQAKGFGRGV